MFLDAPTLGQDDVCLVDPIDGEITKSALIEQRNAWSRRLEALKDTLGAKPLIEIEIAPRAEVIAAYLGALHAGFPVILTAPGQADKDDRIRQIYQPNALISLMDGSAVLTELSNHPADLHPDLRLLLSTSGSTGDPKLVRLSEDALRANAASIAEYMGLSGDDVGITSLPLHYSFGLSILHSHLSAGAKLVLTDASLSDAAFATYFASHGVTNLQCVPHQIGLLDAATFDYQTSHRFRLLAQAGGRLERSKVEALAERGQGEGWQFLVMYGQTEAAPRMAYLPPALAVQSPDAIGVAVPGGRFEIVDDQGAVVTEPGRSGELIYFGPNVMMGYAMSRADLSFGPQIDRLKTGDVAEWTANGLLRLIGRDKRFVKLYGLRLNLDQIEIRLQAEGLAAHAVAVDDRLVILTPNAGQIAQIQQHVSAAYDLPLSDVAVARIEAVPVLPNGKTDLRGLSDLARRHIKAAENSAASSLRDTYAGALRSRKVTGADSFSSLGGDSLAYLHVQLAIEKRLGHIPEGWEGMTVAELEALEPTARSGWVMTDAQTVLRILAISSVVLFHANHWPLMGGTSALILLFGNSLARFMRSTIAEGNLLRLGCALLCPIVPFYFILITLYDALRGGVPNSMFLLVDNFHKGVQVPLVEPYWFVSLYAQLVAVVLVVAAVGPLRRQVAEAPFQLGAIGFALSIFAAFVADWAAPMMTGQPLSWRSTTNFLPLLLLGWMACTAKSRDERSGTLAALCVVLAVFPIPNPAYVVLVAGGTLLLIMEARLPLPRRAVRIANRLASATFFVFLLHNMVIHALKHSTSVYAVLGPWAGGFLVLAVSFAVALVADQTLQIIARKAASFKSPRPTVTTGPQPAE